MTMKTIGQGFNTIPTPTWGDPQESLATVWAALEDYRVFVRPEGEGDNDSAWDNVTTAMAWLEESTSWEAETMLEAAACLWEAVQEAQGNGVTTPGLESYLVGVRAGYRSQGVAAMRAAVISSAMVTALETGYRAAVAEGFDSPFDWQFCPDFVRDCMAWDGGLPTLRPDYLDRCKAIGRADGKPPVFRSDTTE